MSDKDPEIQKFKELIDTNLSKYEEKITIVGDVRDINVEDMFNSLFDNVFVYEGIRYLFPAVVGAKTNEEKLEIIQHRSHYEDLRVLRFLEASNGILVLPAI